LGNRSHRAGKGAEFLRFFSRTAPLKSCFSSCEATEEKEHTAKGQNSAPASIREQILIIILHHSAGLEVQPAEIFIQGLSKSKNIFS
jgi:hypothetical protein